MSKLDNYNQKFIQDNMMGPNSMRILEEMMDYMHDNLNINFKAGMRVLDLGCGRGLTSIFLAKEYGVDVYAVDLWTSATENYNRFQELGVDDKITPLCLDFNNNNNKIFADNYFDAVISVDSYHYFGNNSTYFSECIKPILKQNAIIGIAFPSIKQDFEFSNIPHEMKPYWEEEAFNMWRSTNWWTNIFKQDINNLYDFKVKELECFNKAWEDWLLLENEYAIGDRDMMKADNNKYMNIIALMGKINK